MLQTAPADAKAARSREMAAAWRAGRLAHRFGVAPPDRPARPARPALLPPQAMPRRRKAGSTATRVALLHAVAHIELNAIDLAWDMVARFGAQFPRAFTDDWVQVGDDEARHFRMLAGRLAALGAGYGDLPAHDGLWQAALETRDNAQARLAIVPMVLEARGLDVTPGMIVRFEGLGDLDSAGVLQVILEDEVGHVAAGQRWFDHLCRQAGLDPKTRFQDLVRNRFSGRLKAPFNRPARAEAGMPGDWYEPLV